MNSITDALATLHKKSVINLINGSNNSIVLRYAATRVSAGVNPVFGDMTRETSMSGITQGPFPCLWYDALAAKSFSSTSNESIIQKLAGQYEEATVFVEVVLDSILEDPTNPFGFTFFDRCQYVILQTNVPSQNNKFKFLGGMKLGLGTAQPYIFMAALKGAVGFDGN